MRRKAHSPHEKSYVMRLAFPTIFENMMSTLVQFADTAMVGSLGAAATAAVAVNASPTWVMNSLVMSVGVGGTALIARLIGGQKQKEAEDACRQVFVLGIAAGLCLMALGYFMAPVIPVIMQADPALYGEAIDYMRIISLGFVPYYTGMALAAAARGAGDMRTPMLVSGAANLLNVIGNFLLIYPSRQVTLLGFQWTMWGAGMGVRGAALSTAVSTGLSGVFMMISLLRGSHHLRLHLGKLLPDFSLIRRILKVGIPAALERLSISLGQMVFISMVASLGTVQLAAHHLAVTIESLSYMPGYGFAAAAATLVGQSLGAEEPEKARLQGGLSIRIAVIVMSFVGVLLYAFSGWWMALFTPEMDVREIGAAILRICAFEQPFTALYIVSSGALRGAGDTRMPFLISLISMWGVRLILAWLFIWQLGLGIEGAWWAMVIDLCFRGLFMLLRFYKGRWVHCNV